MSKFLSVVVLAAVFAGAAASAASATTGPAMLTDRNPTGTGSNTALTAGFDGATNLPPTVFKPDGPAVSMICPDVDFKITRVTTNTAQFDASYGPNCTSTVSGITLAFAFDVGCPWTLTFQNATFNDTTATGTGATVDLPCSTLITVPAVSCVITVAAGRYGHIGSQNINTSGGNDTSASPTGMRLTPTLTGLNYTSNGNCSIVGFAASGTISYTGPFYIHNVWGML